MAVTKESAANQWKTKLTRFLGPTLNCSQCRKPIPTQSSYCLHCGKKQNLVFSQKDPENAVNGEKPPNSLPTTSNAPAEVPPVLPPGLKQFFVPLRNESTEREDLGLIWFEPRLLAFADVLFEDKKHHLEYEQTYQLLCYPPDAVDPDPWKNAEWVADNLDSEPTWEDAFWAEVPASLNDPKKLKTLEREFTEFLCYKAYRTVLLNDQLGFVSNQDENREAFELRCQQAVLDAQSSKKQSATGKIQEITLTPKKGDVRVTHFGVAWVPMRSSNSADEPREPLYEVLRKMSAQAWDEADVLLADGTTGQ